MLKLALVGGVPTERPATPLHPLQHWPPSSSMSRLLAPLQCIEIVGTLGNHVGPESYIRVGVTA